MTEDFSYPPEVALQIREVEKHCAPLKWRDLKILLQQFSDEVPDNASDLLEDTSMNVARNRREARRGLQLMVRLENGELEVVEELKELTLLQPLEVKIDPESANRIADRALKRIRKLQDKEKRGLE